ncbi:Kinesin-like protein kif2a [Homalodisca vitripennis]|nr:Kinesin-like protein kif2a [Homalodisca vitripennis]
MAWCCPCWRTADVQDKCASAGAGNNSSIAEYQPGGGEVLDCSQGRVHPAVVSGVNTQTRCVTVEWFEQGETKGKEIEIEAILALNLHLATNLNNQNHIPNNQAYPLARESSEEEEEEEEGSVQEDMDNEVQANGNLHHQQRPPSTATLPIRTLPSRSVTPLLPFSVLCVA